MSCKNYKCLCNKLIISQAVTFDTDTLTINIPEGNYAAGCKYCIVVAQPIPTTTTIGANVVITIGDDTTEYPLTNCDCTNVSACSISSRTRYSVVVHTDIASGVFKLLGKLPCSRCVNNLAALPVPTTDGAAAASTQVTE